MMAVSRETAFREKLRWKHLQNQQESCFVVGGITMIWLTSQGEDPQQPLLVGLPGQLLHQRQTLGCSVVGNTPRKLSEELSILPCLAPKPVELYRLALYLSHLFSANGNTHLNNSPSNPQRVICGRATMGPLKGHLAKNREAVPNQISLAMNGNRGFSPK